MTVRRLLLKSPRNSRFFQSSNLLHIAQDTDFVSMSSRVAICLNGYNDSRDFSEKAE
jgi:hypothetical protein